MSSLSSTAPVLHTPSPRPRGPRGPPPSSSSSSTSSYHASQATTSQPLPAAPPAPMPDTRTQQPVYKYQSPPTLPPLSLDTGPILVQPRPSKPVLQLPMLGATPNPSPKPTLTIPAPVPRSLTRPAISLNTGNNPRPDSPGAGGYYTFPTASITPFSSEDSADVTLRPPLPYNPHANSSHDDLEDVRKEIDRLKIRDSARDSEDESNGPMADMDEHDAAPWNVAAPPAPVPHRQAPSVQPPTPTAWEDTDEWSDKFLVDLRQLGEGAGGAVAKVKDVRTGEIYARKTIPTRSTPPRQLLRELSFLSQSQHPNIIKFFGAYISPSSSEVKVIMEVCEGGSLEDVGKRVKELGGRVGEKVMGRLAEGILRGLAHLHSKKIVHRDIKPSNILLTRQGVIRLCDFGVSGELVDSVAGTFTGTSWYMAPERIKGLPYSIRADVWSTGLSLLELAQNRFPYPPDLGPIELVTYIVSGEIPELRDEEPDANGVGGVRWSEGMKDFIRVCLTLNPEQRPNPKEMLDHSWIKQSEQSKINMAKWISQFWGWEYIPPVKSGKVRDRSRLAEERRPRVGSEGSGAEGGSVRPVA